MPVPIPNASARAVVTGGSSGIGVALATELAGRGHSLILVARRAELMEELAATLRAECGVQVEVRAVDLADRDARQVLVTELASREISILCNNAGTATFGALATLDPAYERAQLELNSVAVHDLTLAVLPGMIARGSGGLLFTGSAAGNMPIPNNTTYAASKAFVNTFSESLREELKPLGINVTLLAPGPVRTELPAEDERSLVEKVVPDFLWVNTEYTARISIDGLEKNKMRIVPGLLSKAMSVAGGYAPRAIVAPIVGPFYKKLGGQ